MRTDLENRSQEDRNWPIKHVLVFLIEDGLTIFHQQLTSQSIDPQQMGGLIWAISASKAVKDGCEGCVFPEDLHLEGFNVTAKVGSVVATVLLHDEVLPLTIGGKLLQFNGAFEKEYGHVLKNWAGRLRLFDQDDIAKIISKYLDLSDYVPHQLTDLATLGMMNSPFAPFLFLIQKNLNDKGWFYPEEIVSVIHGETGLPRREIRVLLAKMRKMGQIERLGHGQVRLE